MEGRRRCGRGRFVAFINANNDAWPDLFLGNETPRSAPSDPCDNPANGLPNEESKLFLNQGGTGLTYAPSFFRFGAGPGQRCAEVLDYNGDGRQDLLTCQLKSKPPRLYRNNGGTELHRGLNSVGLTSAVSDAFPIDIDKDGDTDLVFAASGAFTYRLNNGGTFGASTQIRAITTGQGRSVAAGDADGDGDIDVYGMVRSDTGESERLRVPAQRSQLDPGDRAVVGRRRRRGVRSAPARPIAAGAVPCPQRRQLEPAGWDRRWAVQLLLVQP